MAGSAATFATSALRSPSPLAVPVAARYFADGEVLEVQMSRPVTGSAQAVGEFIGEMNNMLRTSGTWLATGDTLQINMVGIHDPDTGHYVNYDGSNPSFVDDLDRPVLAWDGFPVDELP